MHYSLVSVNVRLLSHRRSVSWVQQKQSVSECFTVLQGQQQVCKPKSPDGAAEAYRVND